MRPFISSVLVGFAALSPAPVQAEMPHTTADGSLGFGAFGARTATTLDAGIDMNGEQWTLGLGARVRVVGDGGVRGEDWDDVSEAIGVIQHATYFSPAASDDAFAWSVAAGPLQGASIGRGAVLWGYSTGVDVDHRRTGFAMRALGPDTQFELMIDDVAAPRVLGGRTAWSPQENIWVGGTFATDWNAPASMDDAAVTAIAGDVSWDFVAARDGFQHTIHGEGVALLGLGAGAHTGYTASWMQDGVAYFHATAEARVGTGSYLPGYFSPLYDVTRHRFDLEESGDMGLGQRDAVKDGGLAGVGARFEVAGEGEGIGEGELSYEARRGTGDVIMGRYALPAWQRVQTGGWVAVASQGRGWVGATALEAVVRLPESLFFRTELTRLYQIGEAGEALPLWVANIAVGAAIGE